MRTNPGTVDFLIVDYAYREGGNLCVRIPAQLFSYSAWSSERMKNAKGNTCALANVVNVRTHRGAAFNFN